MGARCEQYNTNFHATRASVRCLSSFGVVLRFCISRRSGSAWSLVVIVLSLGVEEFFSARVPSSSAEVRGLVIHDIKEVR